LLGGRSASRFTDLSVSYLQVSSELLVLAWIQPLFLTFQLVVFALVLAATLGVAGGWAASKLQAAGRFWSWIAAGFLATMVVAVAMPMILQAAAWEATAGKFGWMIMTQTGARAEGLSDYGFFRGLIACGWIHGLLGAALVALATWYGLDRVPSHVQQKARMDLGPVSSWWCVQLPLASPWIISSLVATAVLAMTEMTVVDLYGFRTVADEFYLFYAVDPSLLSIFLVCVLPLMVMAVLMTWLLVQRRKFVVTHVDAGTPQREDQQARKSVCCVAAAVAILIGLLIVLAPLGGLLVKVGHDVEIAQGSLVGTWSFSRTVQRLWEAPAIFSAEYRWTGILAVSVALSAVLIAWPLAAVGRQRRRLEAGFDLLTIGLVLLPGPLVGLMVVRFFQLPIPGFSTLYQQTLVPTVIALLFRAVPAAYWVLRAGYRGLDNQLLDTAQLDHSWIKRVWGIDRPLLQGSLWGAGIAAAIVASGDVPATLPVVPPGVTTVGTRLFGLLHSGARYQEAALAMWYLAVVLVISLFLARRFLALRVKVH
jgi:iron(III) transport system permease protein